VEYPEWYAGNRITAGRLREMLPSYTVKAGTTSRASTTAQTADPELSGIALAAGMFEIKVRYIATGVGSASAGGLATSWGFTGTATGNRNGPSGPGFTSTNSGAAENLRSNSASMGLSTQFYYLATTSTSIVEEGLVTVTVAGNFSVNWAQAASNATATNLLAGSYVKIKQIA
jgi:hypothetical protein